MLVIWHCWVLVFQLYLWLQLLLHPEQLLLWGRGSPHIALLQLQQLQLLPGLTQ